jgi:hypothetical protein
MPPAPIPFKINITLCTDIYNIVHDQAPRNYYGTEMKGKKFKILK